MKIEIIEVLKSRCLESDYAKRRDFQDEADPTRREIKIYWIYRIARSGRKEERKPLWHGGAFVCLQDVPTGLLQLDVLLAVLDVDAAEGGRDFGAKVAAVDGEDARVVDNLLLGLHIINSNTAASNIAIAFKM